jgi:phosphinothricin acetyltransferase
VRLIDCTEQHAESILAIFNEAIVNSTALYDYQPRTREMMTTWFENKRRGNFPVIGIVEGGDDEPSGSILEAGDGTLLGFASYGPFRAFPAYKYTVEHSLYVASPHRGCGVGKLLLKSIIERARSQDYHVMVGAIDSANAASIALHEKFNFTRVGTLPQVGFKFGRWLDLVFYQRLLDTPANPVDG